MISPGSNTFAALFKLRRNIALPIVIAGTFLTVGCTKEPPSAVGEVKIKDGNMYPYSLTLKPEETKQLVAEVLPDSAINKNVTWSSTDPEAVTVTNGLITAKKGGSMATITVTTEDGNKTASIVVTVDAILVEAFRIDIKGEINDISGKTLVLKAGETKNLLISDILPMDATDKTISRSSRNPKVATCIDGLLTAVAPGKAVINISSEDGGATASFTVLVIYNVSDEAQLRAMANDLEGYYVLTQDIPLTQEWNPIGASSETPFSGTLDGKGFSIKGLYINKPNQDFVGLIGFNTGTIKNIGVEVAPQGITGDANVGALAGGNAGYVSGKTTGSGGVTGEDHAGGLVGVNSQGTVIGLSTISVSAMYYYGGGLVGETIIAGSLVVGYATGVVTIGVNNGGGLVGHVDGGSVVGYATGNVDAKEGNSQYPLVEYVGGLIGNNEATASGYARGTVSTDRRMSVYIGRAVGDGGTGSIYYSGASGESGFTYTGSSGSVTPNILGTQVTITTATTAADFPNLAFGTEVGQWTFFAGKWPAINFPADQSIFDSVRGELQPIAP